MEAKSVLKSLRDFAARELKEKRADRVVVCRAKMKQWLRRGRLPDTRVRGVEGARYFICVFRGDELTLYLYDGGGASLGAMEFKGGEKEKVWADISKNTKSVFALSAYFFPLFP